MELRANELRIGNYVNYRDKERILIVSNLGSFRFETVCHNTGIIYGSDDDSEYNGIPLTEEWLLKFGFKNIDSTYTIDNDRFEFSFIFYDAWNLYYKEKKGFGCDEINLTGFWNIHQIQNLYFALTGVELKIKPLN